MTEKSFIVSNKLGLHARPAAMFVHTAAEHKCNVKVSKNINGENIVVNGKSVMGLMMLAAACGEEIRILLEGEDEAKALAAFEDLFARNFDE